MRSFTNRQVHPKRSGRLVLGLLAFTTILAGWALGQSDDGALTPARVGEGCLLYRSPLSGRYETVPLVHTDLRMSGLRSVVGSGECCPAPSVGHHRRSSEPEPPSCVDPTSWML